MPKEADLVQLDKLIGIIISADESADFAPYTRDGNHIIKQILGKEGFLETGYLQSLDINDVGEISKAIINSFNDGNIGYVIDLLKEIHFKSREIFNKVVLEMLNIFESQESVKADIPEPTFTPVDKWDTSDVKPLEPSLKTPNYNSGFDTRYVRFMGTKHLTGEPIPKFEKLEELFDYFNELSQTDISDEDLVTRACQAIHQVEDQRSLIEMMLGPAFIVELDKIDRRKRSLRIEEELPKVVSVFRPGSKLSNTQENKTVKLNRKHITEAITKIGGIVRDTLTIGGKEPAKYVKQLHDGFPLTITKASLKKLEETQEWKDNPYGTVSLTIGASDLTIVFNTEIIYNEEPIIRKLNETFNHDRETAKNLYRSYLSRDAYVARKIVDLNKDGIVFIKYSGVIDQVINSTDKFICTIKARVKSDLQLSGCVAIKLNDQYQTTLSKESIYAFAKKHLEIKDPGINEALTFGGVSYASKEEMDAEKLVYNLGVAGDPVISKEDYLKVIKTDAWENKGFDVITTDVNKDPIAMFNSEEIYTKMPVVTLLKERFGFLETTADDFYEEHLSNKAIVRRKVKEFDENGITCPGPYSVAEGIAPVVPESAVMVVAPMINKPMTMGYVLLKIDSNRVVVLPKEEAFAFIKKRLVITDQEIESILYIKGVTFPTIEKEKEMSVRNNTVTKKLFETIDELNKNGFVHVLDSEVQNEIDQLKTQHKTVIYLGSCSGTYYRLGVLIDVDYVGDSGVLEKWFPELIKKSLKGFNIDNDKMDVIIAKAFFKYEAERYGSIEAGVEGAYSRYGFFIHDPKTITYELTGKCYKLTGNFYNHPVIYVNGNGDLVDRRLLELFLKNEFLAGEDRVDTYINYLELNGIKFSTIGKEKEPNNKFEAQIAELKETGFTVICNKDMGEFKEAAIENGLEASIAFGFLELEKDSSLIMNPPSQREPSNLRKMLSEKLGLKNDCITVIENKVDVLNCIPDVKTMAKFHRAAMGSKGFTLLDGSFGDYDKNQVRELLSLYDLNLVYHKAPAPAKIQLVLDRRYIQADGVIKDHLTHCFGYSDEVADSVIASLKALGCSIWTCNANREVETEPKEQRFNQPMDGWNIGHGSEGGIRRDTMLIIAAPTHRCSSRLVHCGKTEIEAGAGKTPLNVGSAEQAIQGFENAFNQTCSFNGGLDALKSYLEKSNELQHSSECMLTAMKAQHTETAKDQVISDNHGYDYVFSDDVWEKPVFSFKGVISGMNVTVIHNDELDIVTVTARTSETVTTLNGYFSEGLWVEEFIDRLGKAIKSNEGKLVPAFAEVLEVMEGEYI